MLAIGSAASSSMAPRSRLCLCRECWPVGGGGGEGVWTQDGASVLHIVGIVGDRLGVRASKVAGAAQDTSRGTRKIALCGMCVSRRRG
jgi:hypothetical protein